LVSTGTNTRGGSVDDSTVRTIRVGCLAGNCAINGADDCDVTCVVTRANTVGSLDSKVCL